MFIITGTFPITSCKSLTYMIYVLNSRDAYRFKYHVSFVCSFCS